MSTEQQVQLIGDFRRDEKVAVAALSPGHLLELTSANEVQKHSTEGGYAERLVAVEDALQGRPITTAYAEDELVSLNVCEPGSEVQIFVAAGQDIDIGDFLISAGDGTLIENGEEGSGVTVRQIVAVAMEAQDLTGSGAVDTLTHVRFL